VDTRFIQIALVLPGQFFTWKYSPRHLPGADSRLDGQSTNSETMKCTSIHTFSCPSCSCHTASPPPLVRPPVEIMVSEDPQSHIGSRTHISLHGAQFIPKPALCSPENFYIHLRSLDIPGFIFVLGRSPSGYEQSPISRYTFTSCNG
jgi:hypothetical protein